MQVWQLTYTYWEVENDGDEEDADGEETDAQRSLRRRKKHKKRTITFDEGWNVHGKVIKEHFQPQ